jgi:hypothetical protein
MGPIRRIFYFYWKMTFSEKVYYAFKGFTISTNETDTIGLESLVNLLLLQLVIPHEVKS